jgi:lauroyl/myristoyl acyltransferase
MTAGDREIAAILEQVENPPHPSVVRAENVGLFGRLLSAEVLHRAVPAAIAVRAALLAGRLAWLRPSTRRRTLERVSPLYGPDADPVERERFARRWLPERLAFYELFWQHDLEGMRVEGIEHLRSAMDRPGGTIMTTVHVGPLHAVYYGLSEQGIKLYILSHDAVVPHVHRGPLAPYQQARARRAVALGAKIVGKGNSYVVLRELLRRGELCLIALDLPSVRGDGPVTSFAGHRVRLATGLAQLAVETDSPIVPAYALREGAHPSLRFLPAIEPSEFDSAEALHRHLSSLGDRLVTSHLEQVNPDFFLNYSLARVQGGIDRTQFAAQLTRG